MKKCEKCFYYWNGSTCEFLKLDAQKTKSHLGFPTQEDSEYYKELIKIHGVDKVNENFVVGGINTRLMNYDGNCGKYRKTTLGKQIINILLS